ncbi:hypothetical protein HaLaN_27909 [Haematococcus lacustris]|uniref:Uncharacterized protein n=1 Tax=Haematococcus lacustris TaxID=44745 RepID=A0A6A0AA40_HAELA|nr:hypothetical protein HaLaN_27909 [Haematococcus lacustris]
MYHIKWAQQRLRLYGAQDRALEQFFEKLEKDIEELSMKCHGRDKQLDAVLRACCKVVCTMQQPGSHTASSLRARAQHSTASQAQQAHRGAADPTQPTKGIDKASKAKPAPQPGTWVDWDCNAALNMQRIGAPA